MQDDALITSKESDTQRKDVEGMMEQVEQRVGNYRLLQLLGIQKELGIR